MSDHERNFDTISPETQEAAQAQTHIVQIQAESTVASHPSKPDPSPQKISRRQFFRIAVLSTLAVTTGAVVFDVLISRTQPLPSIKPEDQLSPDVLKKQRMKILHEVAEMRAELEVIEKMTPQNNVNIKISGEIIAGFTIGDGYDKMDHPKKTLGTNLEDYNKRYNEILEAKLVLNDAETFLNAHPDYSATEFRGWLRREYSFLVEIVNKSGSKETYMIDVISTYAPNWEDVPNQGPTDYIRPQDKFIDFSIRPAPPAAGQSTQTLYPLGFDVRYAAGPRKDRFPRFAAGENGRGDASKDKLYFIQEYVAPILASVQGSEGIKLSNSDALMPNEAFLLQADITTALDIP